MTSKPRGRSAVRRGPSEPLSRERILAAALAQTQAEGLAALSTRKLGERLGCEAMSIYHHFPSKHHLLDAMVDHAIASIEWPAPGGAPLQRLRELLYAYRAMAHRFPALFPLVGVHRLNTPTGVRFIEGALALIHDVLPDAELAARHFRTLGYYLVGAALDETSGYARGPSAAEPVDDELLERECPRLVAAAPFFQARQWDATFALGAEAMLAALARDAAQHGERPG
jgi:AcrR family transcriptional regulator